MASPSSPRINGEVTSVTSRSYCKSHSDPNGYAQLAYRTTGGSKAYILQGAAAVSSQDAQADGGRLINVQGSVTMPFNCAGDYDTYRIDVYNIESHGGLTFTVRYNA